MLDVGRARVGDAGGAHPKRLLAEGVFHLIGERIVSGELAPGDRIRDADLAQELEISRTPVREALQRLERVGLVTMYPSRYTEVSTLTSQAVQTTHEFAAHQAGFVVRMACPRLTDAERGTVSALIATVIANADDPVACGLARGDVLGYLAVRTDNPMQRALLDDASLAMARALKQFDFGPNHREKMIAGCVALDAAILANDRDAAEHACRVIYAID